MNKVTKDILPFCIADGNPSVIRGINKVGLERNGFGASQIQVIRSAYRTLLRKNIPLQVAIAQLKDEGGSQPEISEMLSFAATSVLGLARPRAAMQET